MGQAKKGGIMAHLTFGKGTIKKKKKNVFMVILKLKWFLFHYGFFRSVFWFLGSLNFLKELKQF